MLWPHRAVPSGQHRPHSQLFRTLRREGRALSVLNYSEAGTPSSKIFLWIFESWMYRWANLRSPSSASYVRRSLLTSPPPSHLTPAHHQTHIHPFAQLLPKKIGDQQPSTFTTPSVVPGWVKTGYSSSGHVQRLILGSGLNNSSGPAGYPVKYSSLGRT